MLGIGFWEMLVICGLILVAVGPDRLPGMVKTVAKFYRQFRRTAEDLRASTGIDDILRDEELKELAELRKQKLQLLQSQVAKPSKPIVAPGLDKPGVEKAGVEKAGVEKAGVEKAGVEKAGVEKAGVEKAGVEKAGAPLGKPAAADPGHAMLGQPIPRTRASAVIRGGLDDKERAMEVPPEGVDLFEARRHEPVVTEDELRLRKQRIAAKLAGKSLEEIIAAEAAAGAVGPGAGAS
jgi:sec-independent protein translocase protein TatB